MAGDSEDQKMEIKKIADTRAHRQGAVRAHINRIIDLLKEGQISNVSAVEEQMKKMLVSRELFKDSHDATMAVYKKYSKDTKDLISKQEKTELDLQEVYKAGHKWTTEAKKQLKSDLEKTLQYGDGSASATGHEEDVQLHTSFEEGDQTIIDTAGRELEEENDALRSQLDFKTQQANDLYEQLQDLSKKVSELTSSQSRVFQLEEMLRSRDKEAAEEKKRKKNEMSRLQDELAQRDELLKQQRDLTSTRRASIDYSYARDPMLSQSTLGRDDISAISQIVAQSNADVMKRMLDQSHDQSKRFYSTMAIPKQELKPFDGDITMYTAYINRFEELVGDTESSDTVKLHSLMQSCTGKALELIECCEHKKASDGYKLARELLRSEYGDAFLISQAWMDKVNDFPRAKTGEQVARFAAMIKSAKETLSTLGYESEMQCTKSMRMILEKTPIHIQNKWRTKHRENTERGGRAKLDDMIKVISNAAKEMTDPIFGSDVMSKLTPTADVKPKRQSGFQSAKKKNAVAASQMSSRDISFEEDEMNDYDDRQEEVKSTDRGTNQRHEQSEIPQREPCVMCDVGMKPAHVTSRCFIYKDMSSKERLEFVREKRLCYMCLSKHHNVTSCTCPQSWKCRMPGCNARHHFTLHRGLMGEKNERHVKPVCYLDGQIEKGEITPYDSETCNAGERYVYRAHSGRLHGRYVLPVVPITLTEPGHFVQTYALLDTGSTVSMISQAVFDKLKIEPVGMADFTLKGVVSSRDMKTAVVDLNIKGRGAFGNEGAFNVLVLEEVSFNEEHVKRLRAAKNDLPHLSHLPLQTHVSNNVNMIIGQDNAHLLEPMYKVSGKHKYAPFAICGRLGWSIHGNATDDFDFWEKWEPSKTVATSLCMDWVPNVSLHDALHDMWQVDKVPEVVPMSPINRKILKLWNDKIQVVDGHYELPIPFKKEPPCLPQNYGQALSSLKSVERRLMKDDGLRVQYVAAMQKNFDMGYAEIAPETPETGYEWYNTHLAVITERRPGKCRIVKNASLMYRNTSLNTSVHQGPNMTANLIEVSLRFRQFRVAITGDIREMYNQVRVPTSQRDCLRFLWWKDGVPGGQVIKCRMKTHMFGTIWAPAACIFAMQHTADMYSKEYEADVLVTVKRDFYVDDWIKSVLSVPIGLKLIAGLRHMLSRVGFDLLKFGSNQKEILLELPPELRAKAYEDVSMDVECTVIDKTLGSLWRPVEDVFGYKVDIKEKPFTRRGLLSVYSSIYDPMGYVGPFVLRAKLIVQSVCKDGGDWDEEIPEEFMVEWKKWLEELPRLAEFVVPRWLGVTLESQQSYRLHVFSDASELGYGANVYLSIIDEREDFITSSLVLSKSKVNPVTHMTVPRLELCAAVLATKLEGMVRKTLEFDVKQSIFWIDSLIVLTYIKHQSKTFKTFVANRVAMIQEVTEQEQWRHVPGKLNIADVASRGSSAEDLLSNREWLSGPEFLRCETLWPEQSDLGVLDSEISHERKKLVLSANKVEVKRTFDKESALKMLNYFSQWTRLVKAVCFWHRFMHYLKTSEVKKGCIDCVEFGRGVGVIVRILQHLFLSTKLIQSPGFKKLFPMTCDGLYRIGGRLTYSKLVFEEIHPIILPRCAVTDLYVRFQHIKTGHSGINRTYYEVRRQFWLLGGKSVVERVVGQCVTCQKFRKKAALQVMAPLPTFRVTVGTAPFENVGMDLFGPLVVRIGRSDYKRYCCLITCFASRAAHVEVLPDLSTSSFIDGLHRFIARRGRPNLVVTDNGTNFVGAVRELSELVAKWNVSKIGACFRENMIKWQFNTPTASHHGGAWERMNRTAREMMMRLVKNETLSEYALLTISCLIENMINSRPLTKLNENSSELLPLTPNHLLLVRQGQGLLGNFSKGDTLRRKWRQVQFLADEFWRRWSREYLDTLQVRQKWMNEQTNFKVGDLVLEVKENLYRMRWPLAIVIEVFPGRDGYVRSVKIKTQNGEYERPITKLVRLEFDE